MSLMGANGTPEFPAFHGSLITKPLSFCHEGKCNGFNDGDVGQGVV